MKSKSLLATMFPKNLNTETLYHIIQNRISLLVVTGAQCTRKKERNTDAVIKPVPCIYLSSEPWCRYTSWIEGGQKTRLCLCFLLL